MIQLSFVIKSDDEEIKTVSYNFNENEVTCKTETFDILLAFLLIIIPILIAVIVYCYMAKYQTKQLLPFQGIKD